MKKITAVVGALALALTFLVAGPTAANAVLKTQSAQVSIVGSPVVSGTLIASVSGLKSGSTVKYTWKVNTPVPTTVTGDSLYLGDYEYTGRTIKLYISAKKSGYKEWKYTSPAIIEGTVTQLKAPTISGSLKTGYELEANCGTYLPQLTSNGGLSECSVQWQANGLDIEGATDTTFDLSSSQIGMRMSALISISAPDLESLEVLVSKSGNVIGTFDLASDPTFTTGSLVGDNVSFENNPTWNVQPTSTKYQWYRSGKKISGATGSDYTLKSDDWHKSIELKITLARANHETKTFAFRAVDYVLKIVTKSGTTKNGWWAWDDCDVSYGPEDWYGYEDWEQECYGSNSSKYANGYSYNDDGVDDYTHMNLVLPVVVDPGSVLDWRAVMTGSVSKNLDIYVGFATARGIEFADYDNSSWYSSSGTWKTNWSTTPPDEDGFYNFWVQANDEDTGVYGTFTVKTVKIEVRYIG